MKSTRSKLFAVSAVLALLVFSTAAFAEEERPERGYVDFGVRYIWGDVYGRPDLRNGPMAAGPTGNPAGTSGCLGCGTPFDPGLKTSKYNEYRDLRNGFFVRRLNATFDNVLNSKNYVNLQSQKTLYRDQSYLATFGQYGRFRIQFRYDEIPHIYSDTVRTLFAETQPGVWTFPTQMRTTLQTTPAATLPSFIAGTGPAFAPGGTSCPLAINCGVVTTFNFLTPSIIRKAGTALVSYNVTPNFNITGSFWRESQNGLRPIGQILSSGPQATATNGYGVEMPETISYWNNLVRVGAEYGKRDWAVQAAYIGSFFQNNIGQMVYDNPFNLSAVGGATPTFGRMDLYPDNQAHYLYVAGATDIGKWLRLMASVSPGWLRQNDAFLPYTTNSGIPQPCEDGAGGAQACTAPPAAIPSLHGDKQTLAMNYTFVTLPWKQFQIKAQYRHYDYNNNTPVHTFTPVEGDVFTPSAATPVPGEDDNRRRATSFNRKDLEVSGNWYFARRSSAKAGYEGEWTDRSFRDANHTLENSVFGAIDIGYWRDLQFRLSYRHSDRKPDFYQDGDASDPNTGDLIPCTNTTNITFTDEQRCHRRFDEAPRLRDRGDALLVYNVTSKASLSGFGGVIQDNYNRAGEGGNSLTPLNFLTGANATTHPYFLYGILKDISYNYGFGGDYAFSSKLTLFAEYSHEHYYRRMISRNRTPTNTADIVTCTNGCDTPNNDWESTTPEPVDIWTVGMDTYFNKKIYFTTYYNLAAGRANTFSRFLGTNGVVPASNATDSGANCANAVSGIVGGTTPACKFVLVGTTAAVSYPEAVSRQHEVVAVFKYKLTKHLWPKVEFRYQQFDNRDPQTSMMTQYMGCISPAPNGPPVTNAVVGCPVQVVSSGMSATPTLSPNGRPTIFYPAFTVGDNSAARYLFLGVDQPSYRAYYISGTMEYHF
jgi:hypothetical protein